MASCKDCLHIDICEILTCNMCDGAGFACDDCEIYTNYGKIPSVKNCKDFKDRNRFVELPCEFLYKCFVLPTIENNLQDITEMKCIGFSLSHDSCNANLITDKNKLYQPRLEAFGKTVFLTKEEAEQALKE